MASAYRAQESWVDAVRAALYELLAFLDEHPGFARLLIVGSLAGEEPLRARRRAALAALARALEADRPPTTVVSLPAPFGADAVVNGLASILHARLQEEPVPSLRGMCGALMGVIALSYLDAGATRCELSRSASLSVAEASLCAGRGSRSSPRCAHRP